MEIISRCSPGDMMSKTPKNLEKRQDGGFRWMVAHLTNNIHEAQIVAGRLESEGIPAMIHTEPGSDALGIHIGRLGEIRVLVRPQDYDHVLNIIEPGDPQRLPDISDRITFAPLDDEDEDDDHE
jgi:hypothetical protein